MINPNEFRVGNYFEWSKWASMGIGADIITKENHYNYEQLREPIRLTEDWLLKFGLMKWKNKDNYSIGSFLVYIIHKLSKNGDGICYGKKSLRVELKHVHQLQNLYFALTGKELTI